MSREAFIFVGAFPPTADAAGEIIAASDDIAPLWGWHCPDDATLYGYRFREKKWKPSSYCGEPGNTILSDVLGRYRRHRLEVSIIDEYDQDESPDIIQRYIKPKIISLVHVIEDVW